MNPFREAAPNILVYTAQYTILTTFGAALAIDTSLGESLDQASFGYLLAVTHLAVTTSPP